MNTSVMTTRASQTSPQLYARVAGILYLSLAILAPFSNFYVLGRLIVPGDAAATARNFTANEMLFRSGIISFIIASLIDVALAWALYIILKPVNKNLSLLAAWLRLGYAIIFAAAVQNLLSALQLLSGIRYLSAFQTSQLDAQAMQFLAAFNTSWDIALVVFGLHLVLVGYLIFRSSFIPGVFGILLLIAGLGYLVQSFAIFLFPDFSLSLVLFTGWGELVFPLWLVIKGVNVERWEKRAREVA